jgi:ectoine hydroxylase-related dioxygenase (phytanoyl-CoA dioxygenase family)
MGKRLSKNEVELYRKDGILFPIPVLDEAEVSHLASAINETELSLGQRPRGQLAGQCHLHFAWARRLVTNPLILDLVEDIIGPDILAHSTTIFKKYPGEGTYVSWHQDGYYMNLDTPDLVSVWIAITDSDLENGCLRVERGSHQKGILAHQVTAASDRNLLTSGIQVGIAVEESATVDVVLRAGQASLHHVNLVHGSDANYSSKARAGFAIRFVAPQVSQRSPHHPVVLVRGGDLYGHFELYTKPAEEDFAAAAGQHIQFSEQLRARRMASGRRA